MSDRTAGASRCDWHTHSDRTDGADTAEAMASAAIDAELYLWGISDHVRADTGWLPDYVRTIRALRRPGITVRCGVEAKMLDSSGRLDLPRRLPPLDYVLIADHQFPGHTQPVHPASIRAAIGGAAMTASDVVTTLIAATTKAVRRSPYRPIVAHLFSLLPKMGLSEADVSDEHRQALADACIDAGGAVEINEKWRCPSPQTVAYLLAAGVSITAGSDAHAADEVGRHDYWDVVMGDPEVVRALAVSSQDADRRPVSST